MNSKTPEASACDLCRLYLHPQLQQTLIAPSRTFPIIEAANRLNPLGSP